MFIKAIKSAVEGMWVNLYKPTQLDIYFMKQELQLFFCVLHI